MAGHRRISTDLFLKYLERSVPRSKVEALLELDLDEFRGKTLSTKSYARLWGWSRGKVRRLLAEYQAHRNALYNASEAGNRRTPDEHLNRHPTSTRTDTLNGTNPNGYARPRAPKRTPDEHPNGPEADTFLEQDLKEPEGKGKTLSESSSTRKTRRVGAIGSRIRELDDQIELALLKAPTESQERRAERKLRFETLGAMFLACSRVTDEIQLRAYFRSTVDIPTGLLEAACDGAIAATEGTFHPDVKTIIAKGRGLVAMARKRARGVA